MCCLYTHVFAWNDLECPRTDVRGQRLKISENSVNDYSVFDFLLKIWHSSTSIHVCIISSVKILNSDSFYRSQIHKHQRLGLNIIYIRSDRIGSEAFGRDTTTVSSVSFPELFAVSLDADTLASAVDRQLLAGQRAASTQMQRRQRRHPLHCKYTRVRVAHYWARHQMSL